MLFYLIHERLLCNGYQRTMVFAKTENAVFPHFGLPFLVGYLYCYLNSKKNVYMQGLKQM